MDYNKSIELAWSSSWRDSSYIAPHDGEFFACGVTNSSGASLIQIKINGKNLIQVQGSNYSRTPFSISLNKNDVLSFDYENADAMLRAVIFVPYKQL